MTSGTRMPTWRERENNKRRERRRRAIAAKIFTGLRMYGNYELPKHCDNNEVLKALCNEAGWIVEQDGTTYRKGSSRPVERMEINSATTSQCASYIPSPASSNFMSPGDGQSLIPWLKHLSTTSSSLPNNYLYIPGGSISAPVTPPLSSPTSRTPDHNWQQQINNSFFVSSTPPSPTRQQQTVPDSEWFSGIQLAQSVPASPTFSLVSRNPFGFKEDQLASGGSRMWTPSQSGTCSPAPIQTGDVPMSEAVAPPPPLPEFAFGRSNTEGLVKAWEGERIHEESGCDDLELTLGNSSTR
ncbi:unnamed protein product [Eruca vesicaria subsp. sativa]|uniref:Protein BZR1 homolog n=1 Tax=Eruca vesicaria subsp. sativa TaxID=29727 RepID=A0ABC8JAK8_ERUVS|nr:unnamed protein product [Eruca vesicaria subsp. sativa]